jgi:hypothetical protein
MDYNVTQKCISHYGKSVYQKYEKERLSLVDAYKKITSEEYMEVTQELRTIQDEDAAKEYKMTNFEHSRFSGVFYYSTNDGLKRHSGYMVLDFDHLDEDLREVASKLITDPCFYTLLLFKSPSGAGLKWVIPVDISQGGHKECFESIALYLKNTYGLIADPACCNVSRTCFLPYDPECYACKEILENV